MKTTKKEKIEIVVLSIIIVLMFIVVDFKNVSVLNMIFIVITIVNVGLFVKGYLSKRR